MGVYIWSMHHHIERSDFHSLGLHPSYKLVCISDMAHAIHGEKDTHLVIERGMPTNAQGLREDLRRSRNGNKKRDQVEEKSERCYAFSARCLDAGWPTNTAVQRRTESLDPKQASPSMPVSKNPWELSGHLFLPSFPSDGNLRLSVDNEALDVTAQRTGDCQVIMIMITTYILDNRSIVCDVRNTTPHTQIAGSPEPIGSECREDREGGRRT